MIFSPPNHPIRSLQQHQQEVIHLNLSLVHHRQVRIIIIIRTKQVHPMTDYQDPKSCKMQQNPFLIELSSTKWKNLLCEQINRRILFVLYILLFSFLFRCRPRKNKISSDNNKYTIDVRVCFEHFLSPLNIVFFSCSSNFKFNNHTSIIAWVEAIDEIIGCYSHQSYIS